MADALALAASAFAHIDRKGSGPDDDIAVDVGGCSGSRALQAAMASRS